MNTKNRIPAVIAAAFGSLTLFLSGSVLFDLFGIRAHEGNYVPFVVWANFICSFLYLIASYGFWTRKKWTMYSMIVATTILTITFVALLQHIEAGGIHEAKTPKAMLFRIAVTATLAAIAWRGRETPNKSTQTAQKM